MPTLNVNLTAPLAKFVEKEIAAGDYQSASELVRDALRLLRQHKAAENEKFKLLKREVALGLEDAEAGRYTTRSLHDIAKAVAADQSRGTRR